MASENISALSIPTYTAGLIQARAYRKLNNFLSKELAKSGLSQPKWAFMGLLFDYKRMRTQQIADILEVEPPFASRIGKELINSGLIEFVPDKRDGRAKLASLTKDGSKLLKKTEKHLRKNMKDYLSQILGPELETYMKVLKHISELD